MFGNIRLLVYRLENGERITLFKCLGEFDKLAALIRFFDENASLELKGTVENFTYHLFSGKENNIPYYAELYDTEVENEEIIDVSKAYEVVSTSHNVVTNFDRFKENLTVIRGKLSL